MKNSPKISVIVPVYNAEKYLRRCIDSILAQTFTDFELLLIDDGSTDKSGEICDKYAMKDSRIRVFHKKNGGVSSARNVGLDNARGEWITFCDADDWVDTLFLNNFIEMNADGDLLVQGFKATNWKNKNGILIISQPDSLIKEENVFDYVLKTFASDQLGYVWCKAFRRKIIVDNQVRFSEEFSMREDLAFVCLYCTYIKSIKNISNAAYNYYYTPLNKKFKEQDAMSVCINIYVNIKKLASDEFRLDRLKKEYVSLAICSLIESAKSVNIYSYCHFFHINFSRYAIYGNSKIRKVRLFKKLYIIMNVTYLYYLVQFIYFLLPKK